MATLLPSETSAAVQRDINVGTIWNVAQQVLPYWGKGLASTATHKDTPAGHRLARRSEASSVLTPCTCRSGRPRTPARTLALLGSAQTKRPQAKKRPSSAGMLKVI